MVTSLKGPALDAAIRSIMAGEKGDEMLARMPDAPDGALIAVARGGSLQARKIVARRAELPETVRLILTEDRAASVSSKAKGIPSPTSKKRSAATPVTPTRTPAEAIREYDSTATIEAINDGTF